MAAKDNEVRQPALIDNRVDLLRINVRFVRKKKFWNIG